MGLGFNDGFKPAIEFWEHECETEGTTLGVEKGYPCNWCGKTEEDFEEKE